MARQSRSSRPSARAAPASHAPSGSRSASTAAHPAQAQHAPAPMAHAQTQQRQPGMLAQAASTMGGAMAGSVIGHGISSMLFGGGSQAPPPAEVQAAPVNQASSWEGQAPAAQCSTEAKDFTKCMDATNDFPSCSYYLEALKACQSAAARY